MASVAPGWTPNKPFCVRSLRYIEQNLKQAAMAYRSRLHVRTSGELGHPTVSAEDRATATSTDVSSKIKRHAAVLVTLCNVRDPDSGAVLPSVLFTVRGSGLRTHSGEISFPGGGVDKEDASFWDAATRETHEELGIHPSCVQPLGELFPSESAMRADTLVHAFAGFLHKDANWKSSQGEPTEEFTLPPIDIQAAHAHISAEIADAAAQHLPREVDHVFSLSLSALFYDLRRRREGIFERPWGRGRYWAIQVQDRIPPGLPLGLGVGEPSVAGPGQRPDSEIGAGGGERKTVEVWGLTGWYLNLFLRSAFPEHWDTRMGSRL